MLAPMGTFTRSNSNFRPFAETQARLRNKGAQRISAGSGKRGSGCDFVVIDEQPWPSMRWRGVCLLAGSSCRRP
jgi:hypothetical protein